MPAFRQRQARQIFVRRSAGCVKRDFEFWIFLRDGGNARVDHGNSKSAARRMPSDSTIPVIDAHLQAPDIQNFIHQIALTILPGRNHATLILSVGCK
jgi:hypothetical protein